MPHRVAQYRGKGGNTCAGGDEGHQAEYAALRGGRTGVTGKPEQSTLYSHNYVETDFHLFKHFLFLLMNVFVLSVAEYFLYPQES